MFGLVVIEVMTLSGHPWIINKIKAAKVRQNHLVSCRLLSNYHQSTGLLM